MTRNPKYSGSLPLRVPTGTMPDASPSATQTAPHAPVCAGPAQPILFDHVPKTGGTALHALLGEALGAGECSPIITGSIGEARAQFARYRCVAGHLYFQPMSDLSDLWAFTVLRRPVERLLSHLAYTRNDITPAGDDFNQQARSLDLLDYIGSDDPRIVDTLSNTLVRHYAPLAWDGSETLAGERSLALAKEALRRFNLIGLTERMAETADLLCWSLGVVQPPRLRELNVGSRKGTLESLPAHAREHLRRLNALDIELYAYAAELHAGCRRRVIFAARAPVAEAAPAAAREASVAAHRARVDFGTREVEVLRIEIYGQAGIGPVLLSGEITTVRVVFRAHRSVDDLTVGFAIHDDHGRLVYATNTRCHGYVLAVAEPSDCAVNFIVRADIGVGHYHVGASVHPSAQHLPTCYHWVDDMASFDVAGNMGWHFEGATKLSAQLRFEGVATTADASAAASVNVQYLNLLAPPLTDFRARLAVGAPLPALPAGQVAVLLVSLVNIGSERWPSVGERSVRLSYHWIDAGGAVAVFDGERTHLPCDVEAGQHVSLWANVRAPDIAGDYRLQLTLVQESVTWLERAGGEMLELAVTIVAR